MTTTAPGQGESQATSAPRRIRPLPIVILLLTLGVIALIIYGNRASGPASGARPLAQLQTKEVHALAVSPADPNTVFAGYQGGVLVSRDQGATWQPTSLQGADALAFGTSAANPQRLYVAGEGMFYRSDDGGNTWAKVNTLLQGADIHALAVSSTDANRLYAAVEGAGIRVSTDGGATWSAPLGDAPAPVNALAAGADQRLYIGSIRGALFLSNDGGQSWQRESLGTSDVTAFAVDPRSGDLYAAISMLTDDGYQGMLYRRDAVSSQWKPIQFNGAGVPVAISVSPQDSRTLLTVTNTGAVYRTRDGGVTWGAGA